MPTNESVIVKIEANNLLVYYFRLVKSLLRIASQQLLVAESLINSMLMSLGLTCSDETVDDFLESQKIVNNILSELNRLDLRTQSALEHFKSKKHD